MNKRLRKLYELLPDSYETINSVMTIGLDKSWRSRVIELAKEKVREDSKPLCLDVCCGTGDTMVELQEQFTDSHIVGADFSLPMLSKVQDKKLNNINLVMAAAEELPFPSGTFDLVTMTFATRNVNTSRETLVRAFSEFKRVLKPNGRFITIETSQPPSFFIRFFFRLYVRLFVTPIGHLISGVKEGYAYLTSSILSFYGANELAAILNDAGFDDVDYERKLFGGVAIHWAQ